MVAPFPLSMMIFLSAISKAEVVNWGRPATDKEFIGIALTQMPLNNRTEFSDGKISVSVNFYDSTTINNDTLTSKLVCTAYDAKNSVVGKGQAEQQLKIVRKGNTFSLEKGMVRAEPVTIKGMETRMMCQAGFKPGNYELRFNGEEFRLYINERFQTLHYREAADRFDSARHLYVDGKYDACLSELQKAHRLVWQYKNSREIEKFCLQGKELIRLKAFCQKNPTYPRCK